MNIARMNRSASLYFMNNVLESVVAMKFGDENKYRLKKKRFTNELAGIIYRTYSEIDLFDLAQVKTSIDN